jgi:DNA (cytosine-5)-methyltransferase 1
MKLLDLFCRAGGAAMGYYRAGFDDITGVDIDPQPNYPFKFIQADAFNILHELARTQRSRIQWDAIHASPICQGYSLGSTRWNTQYENQLPRVEDYLRGLKIPFVIENVERAPFTMPTITLCGIQFGINIIRHRKFASNILLFGQPHTKKHPPRGEFVTCAGHGGNGSNKYSVWADAMGIEWMSKTELAQAVPWVYTEFVGKQLMAVLR